MEAVTRNPAQGANAAIMKKLIYTVSFLALSSVSYGQVVIALIFGEKLNAGKLEFGLVVAPILTDITNESGKLRPGLSLGLYFNIKPDNKFSYHIEGTAKGTFGAKGIIPYDLGNDSLNAIFSQGELERKIKAFSLPASVRYALSKKFFLEAGIQANMLLKVQDIFTNSFHEGDMEYTLKVSDQYNKLDFGFIAGFHYKFRNDKRSMGMGLRYFQGVTDIYKTAPGTQANRGWFLNISIPVGVSAKPKENTTPN